MYLPQVRLQVLHPNLSMALRFVALSLVMHFLAFPIIRFAFPQHPLCSITHPNLALPLRFIVLLHSTLWANFVLHFPQYPAARFPFLQSLPSPLLYLVGSQTIQSIPFPQPILMYLRLLRLVLLFFAFLYSMSLLFFQPFFDAS